MPPYDTSSRTLSSGSVGSVRSSIQFEMHVLPSALGRVAGSAQASAAGPTPPARPVAGGTAAAAMQRRGLLGGVALTLGGGVAGDARAGFDADLLQPCEQLKACKASLAAVSKQLAADPEDIDAQGNAAAHRAPNPNSAYGGRSSGAMLRRNSCRAVVLKATHNNTRREGWAAGGKFFFESEVERLEANKQYVEAASKVHTR